MWYEKVKRWVYYIQKLLNSTLIPYLFNEKKKYCWFVVFQVAETVFDTINHEYDKVEQKKKQKNRAKFGNEEKESDCILHGYVKKLVSRLYRGNN